MAQRGETSISPVGIAVVMRTEVASGVTTPPHDVATVAIVKGESPVITGENQRRGKSDIDTAADGRRKRKQNGVLLARVAKKIEKVDLQLHQVAVAKHTRMMIVAKMLFGARNRNAGGRSRSELLTSRTRSFLYVGGSVEEEMIAILWRIVALGEPLVALER